MEATKPSLRVQHVKHVTGKIKTELYLAVPPQRLQSIPATDSHSQPC